MDDIARFLQVQRLALLRYLDGQAPQTADEPGPLEYVQGVLDEWLSKYAGRVLPEPCLRERTFWFALYQLEELTENPVHGALDPYERFLLEDLAMARELLRTWSELPEGYYATRPGEFLSDEN